MKVTSSPDISAPRSAESDADGLVLDTKVGRLGLSKREYFAGQALMGQLAFSPPEGSFEKANSPEDVARVCVEMADALIARLKAAGGAE